MKRQFIFCGLLTAFLIGSAGEMILCKTVFAQDTTKVKSRLQNIGAKRQRFNLKPSRPNFVSDRYEYVGFIGTKPIQLNYQRFSYSNWNMTASLNASFYLFRRPYRPAFYSGLPEYFFQRDESRRLLGAVGNTYIFFHP